MTQSPRVVLANTNDIEGGAAIATFRLFLGLRDLGVEARLLVNKKATDHPFVMGPTSDFRKGVHLVSAARDKFPLRSYRNRTGMFFSVNGIRDDLAKRLTDLPCDLLHLNWINHAFVRIESFPKLPKPMIWTLHDMWGFTGGCHYSEACEKWRTRCGVCPVLGSDNANDLSTKVFGRKERSWKELPLTIVTPSKWLTDCAKASPLLGQFDARVIPNGLDIERFKPIDRMLAREILNLPKDRKLILFGAQYGARNPYKGYDLMTEALETLESAGWHERADLVVFGQSRPAEPKMSRFQTHYMGVLHDEVAMALLYSAADVMVAPSRQEAFCQTASESLACGTPVVAFAATGLLDVVGDDACGYLVKPYDAKELAHGIQAILALSPDGYARKSESARERARILFDVRTTAGQYRDLYAEVADRERSQSRSRS